MPVSSNHKKRIVAFVSAFVLAAVVAIAVYGWLMDRSEGQVDISLTVQGAKGGYVQVFYTTDEHQMFNARQNKLYRIASDSVRCTFEICTSVLYDLRIDFECPSGEVILSDVRVKGKTAVQVPFRNLGTKQVSILDQTDGRIILKAEGSDPYIYFLDSVAKMSARKRLSWNQFLLLFIVFSLTLGVFYLFGNHLCGYAGEVPPTDILFGCLVAIMVLTPSLRINKAEKAEAENRYLAVMPKLFDNMEVNGSFGTGFEAWYNDRFFLRQELVEGYDRLIHLLSFIGVQNSHYFVGKDGWAFSKTYNGIENYQNKILFDDGQLANAVKYLTDLDTWCRQHGKQFYYVIIPDKNKIYGEYYRFVKKVRPDTESRAYQLVHYLEDNTDVKVLYLREALLNAKSDDNLLYYKNDIHWTEYGGYIGYKAFMEILSKDFDLEAANCPISGTYIYPNGDAHILFPNGIAADSITEYKSVHCPPMYARTSDESQLNVFLDNPQGKYSGYFFRDSFSNLLVIKYLGNDLRRSVLRWRYYVTPEDLQYITDNHFDFVVLEQLERYLFTLSELSFPQN